MKKSTNIGNLMASLAKSQSEFPEFKKEKAAYNYKYLTLDNILTKVLPILGKNGIAVVQEHRMELCDGLPFVIINTELFCGEEWISQTLRFPLGEPNKGSTEIMQCGSVASYLRRYSLMAMLGISGGDKEIEEINDEENSKIKLK